MEDDKQDYKQLNEFAKELNDSEEPIEVEPLYMDRSDDVLATARNMLLDGLDVQVNFTQQLYIPTKEGYYIVTQFTLANGSVETFFRNTKGWQQVNEHYALPYLNFERAAGAQVRSALADQKFLQGLSLEVRVKEAIKQSLKTQGLFLRSGYFMKDGT